MSNTSAVVQVNVDQDLLNEVELILNDVGITPSEAIRILYTQISVQGEFPRSLLIPNKETLDALAAKTEPETYYSAQEILKNI